MQRTNANGIAHLNHIKRVAGVDYIGIGAGYDGINQWVINFDFNLVSLRFFPAFFYHILYWISHFYPSSFLLCPCRRRELMVKLNQLLLSFRIIFPHFFFFFILAFLLVSFFLCLCLSISDLWILQLISHRRFHFSRLFLYVLFSFYTIHAVVFIYILYLNLYLLLLFR